MDVKGKMRPADWGTAAWAALLICGVLLLVTWPISPWRTWDWQGQTAAAWVQAAGSILAIVGTAAVMLWQHRIQLSTERSAQLQDEYQWLKALIQLLALAEFRAANVLEYVESSRGWEAYEEEIYPYEDFDSLVEAFRLTKVDQTPNPSVMLAVLSGRSAYEDMVALIRACAQVNSTRGSMPLTKEMFASYRDRLDVAKGRLLMRQRELAEQFG